LKRQFFNIPAKWPEETWRNPRLPRDFPAPWAAEWGEDREYGLYMVLDVKGVRQCFRWIAPGSFKMGSPEGEVDRRSDEQLHDVTLTQGFWLADTACSQALWIAVMENNPSRFHDDSNNPVEKINWDEAQSFIERLNGMFSNLHARLPTEAEWEYACRAGTETSFSFGENISPEQLNFDGGFPYAGGDHGLYREKTVPVKSMPANPWGLYQMHGNVWEWCADWNGEYGEQAVVDPIGPPEGMCRVLRGGGWGAQGSYCRSASRSHYWPFVRESDVGFRLALGQKKASAEGQAG
jgi:formylglycine-generating enzyme required for sulfatase activity